MGTASDFEERTLRFPHQLAEIGWLSPFLQCPLIQMPSEMSPEEFRAAGHQVVDWIADYLRDIRNLPVVPDVQPGALIDRLPKRVPNRANPWMRFLPISAT